MNLKASWRDESGATIEIEVNFPSYTTVVLHAGQKHSYYLQTLKKTEVYAFFNSQPDLSAMTRNHFQKILGKQVIPIDNERSIGCVKQEFVGRSLQCIVGERNPSDRIYVIECEAIKIINQVSAVLEEGQRFGIYHGDISPDSIFSIDGHTFKVGFVNRFPGYRKLMWARIVKGLESYHSPEMTCLISNESEEDVEDPCRSDVYSLAATIIGLARGLEKRNGKTLENLIDDLYYSNALKDLLRKCVCELPSDRPDPSALLSEISGMETTARVPRAVVRRNSPNSSSRDELSVGESLVDILLSSRPISPNSLEYTQFEDSDAITMPN